MVSLRAPAIGRVPETLREGASVFSILRASRFFGHARVLSPLNRRRVPQPRTAVMTRP